MAKKKALKKSSKKSVKKKAAKRSNKTPKRSKKATAAKAGKKNAANKKKSAKAKSKSAKSKKKSAAAKPKKLKASKASRSVDEIVIEAGESDPSLKGVPIANMTAKQLHLFVENFNWDGECKPILEAIRHPKCDLGTALLAYWLGAPDFACEFTKPSQVPSYYRQEYALLTEIERRVEQGAYKNARIAFDPHNVFGSDMVASLDVKAMKRPIPAAMMQKTGK